MLKDIFTLRQTTLTKTGSQQVKEDPYVERVVLPDGQVMLVARGSLAAAKAVVAARKVALRRMAEQCQGGHDITFLVDRSARSRRAS